MTPEPAAAAAPSRSWLFALVLLALAGAVNLSFVHNRLHYASDAKVYLATARSLAAGEGYTYQGEPQTIWPPGYPLAIAAAQGLAPDAIWLVKLLNVLFATAALFCFYAAFRRRPEVPGALLVVLLAGLFFPWIYYSQQVGSEPLYFLCVGLIALLAARCVEQWSPGRLAAIAIACALTPMVRLAGIGALVAFAWLLWLHDGRGVRLWRERRWSTLATHAGLTLAVLLPTIAWFWRNRLVSAAATGYAAAFDNEEFTLNAAKLGVEGGGLLSRVYVNIIGYIHVWLVPDLANVERVLTLPLAARLACWAIALVMLAGWAWSLRQPAWRTIGIFYAAYGGTLLAFGWYDMRYLTPVLPLYLLYLVFAGYLILTSIFDRIKRRPAWFTPALIVRAGLIALVLASLAITVGSGRARRLRATTYDGAAQDLYLASTFLREQPAAGRVLVQTPGFIDLWSGRDLVSIIPMTREYGDVWAEAIPDDVRFLLTQPHIADYHGAYVVPFLAQHGDAWREVFRSGEVIVYERVDGAP